MHRDSIAEVLLTDLIRIGETKFLIAAQWPRSHRVYRPDHNGRHDPMLILESVRQIGLAASHLGFGVGFDQQSLMREVGFALDQRTEPRALLRSTNLAITVSCRDVILRAGQLRGMTLDLSFAADDLQFATGCGTVRWISADKYAALRARTGHRLDWDQLRWTTHRPAPGAIAACETSRTCCSPPSPDRARGGGWSRRWSIRCTSTTRWTMPPACC